MKVSDSPGSVDTHTQPHAETARLARLRFRQEPYLNLTNPLEAAISSMRTTTTPSAGQSPSSHSPPSSRPPPWTPTSPPSRPSVRLRSPTPHPPCGALTRAAADGPWPRPWRAGDWALTSDGVDRWPSGCPEPDRRGEAPPPSLSSSPAPPRLSRPDPP